MIHFNERALILDNLFHYEERIHFIVGAQLRLSKPPFQSQEYLSDTIILFLILTANFNILTSYVPGAKFFE